MHSKLNDLISLHPKMVETEESPKGCLDKFALGAPQNSLQTRGTSSRQIFQTFGLFFLKIMRSSIALRLTLNIFRFYLGASLTMFDSKFTRII